MRLLYVLDRFPVLSETFVVDEVRGLLAAGDDVTVYARRGGDAGVAADLRELVVGPGSRAGVRGVRAALALRERGALHALAEARWLAEHVRADHAHAHFAFGAAAIALLYGRIAGVPASFTAHARDLYGGVPSGVLGRKVAAAEWAAAPSEHGARRLRECAPRGSVVVQRNGVDRERVQAGPPESPPRIVAIGRLVEKKGFDVLASAAEQLDAVVEIVGDGPERARLEGGRVHLSGCARSWRRARAPARRDGVRPAVPRAAVGRPRRVARGDRRGDERRRASRDDAGRRHPRARPRRRDRPARGPDDADALARALGRLLEDAALRDRLAAAGRAATEPWDAARCIAQLRARFAPS